MDFTNPGPQVKLKVNKNIGKYLEITRELKRSAKNLIDSDTNLDPCTWNGPKRRDKENGGIGNHRANHYHVDHSIVKINHK